MPLGPALRSWTHGFMSVGLVLPAEAHRSYQTLRGAACSRAHVRATCCRPGSC